MGTEPLPCRTREINNDFLKGQANDQGTGFVGNAAKEGEMPTNSESLPFLSSEIIPFQMQGEQLARNEMKGLPEGGKESIKRVPLHAAGLDPISCHKTS